MLTLVLGRAGTGKTAFVMEDVKRRMDAGETGLLLIVPEQYSHDAERLLCGICGDKLSLHGETLSFTRLCGRVFTEAGGAPGRIIDAGGQILIMHRALETVAHKLRVYGKTGMRAELVKKLLDTVRELKSLGMSPEKLEQTAIKASKHLADKLHDISLILGAYNSILHMHGADPADRLAMLADMIGGSGIGEQGHIYFDGFNDFTAQEVRVIRELLRKDAGVTVCLTLDPGATADAEAGDSEIFELPRNTADNFRKLAEEYGVEVGTVVMGAGSREQGAGDREQGTGAMAAKAEELRFLERHLFGFDRAAFPGQCDAIELYAAPTKYEECEYAAHHIRELVREGYRWRDVGVMARNWDEYGSVCENVFEKYGVPFFAGGREDVTEKPPVAFIDAALEVAASGFEYRPVFRFIKTGLAGITTDDCSELENYVIKWRIRGALWAREWILPPPGYNERDHVFALERLNCLRRKLTEPLFRLRDGIKGVTEADAKLRALFAFFEDMALPERLAEKTAMFEKRGETRLADEYAQLWEIVRSALDQSHTILDNTRLSAVEFRKLFILTLSSYDVGVIPVSLDRTAIGGIAMNRRRDLKCLIVLGATDENMPMLSGSAGAFSDNEREELAGLGAELPSGPQERLSREMNMLYCALAMPSHRLIVTYPTAGERPSIIVKRIKAMFGIPEKRLREEEYMSAAPAPCFELAALFGNTNSSGIAAAAREYFRNGDKEAKMRLTEADEIVHAGRGRLSEAAARSLYGGELSLSATRVDRYYSCPFAHFLYNGLRLAPRVVSRFDAPEAGTFMHYVLEGVSRGIKDTTGFKNADEETGRALTSGMIEKYAREELFGFEGKNERFIYLFRRLEDDVQRVVHDMLSELRRSDFEPLAFELRLEPRGGVADRVDGWSHNGKRYLRVIDYKTGRKTFDLTEILYGRNMQLLIYLFALKEHGNPLSGGEIVPSGALYMPARDVILKAARNTGGEELAKLRERELRRGGLILDDPDVIEAMENGDEKKYLPVKTSKDGGVGGESLVNAGQMALLSKHVGHMLRGASNGILGGNMECSPYYKSENDNACLYCDYHTVCGFDESAGDRYRYAMKLKADEVWERLGTADNAPQAERV